MNNKLPVEQKGCKKKCKGTKDQLLVDKMILCNCRKRHTNQGMAWIDSKKAYDMVSHSWILERLDIRKTCKCLTASSNLLKDQWQIGKQS